MSNSNRKPSKPGVRPTGRRWTQLRQKVLRSSPYCSICGEIIDHRLAWPDPMSGVVDHVIPVSRKATDPWDPSGLAAAHKLCNERKGNGLNRTNPTSRRWLRDQ